MPRTVRTGGLVALAVLLVAVAAVVGVRAWRSAQRTDLQRAVALVPDDAQRLSFTDWVGVRRELGADLDAGSTTTAVGDFLDRAFERDLSSTSALLESSEVLQTDFGFSPASVEWEVFAQGQGGAAVLLRLPESTDLGGLGDTFEELGYTRPDDETGVWDGGGDLVARISDGRGLSPEFQFLALLPDEHLLVASDTASYAAVAAGAAAGDSDTLAGLDDVVAGAGDALSAAVFTGDYACGALAMSSTDDSDQALAEQLVDDAGEVNPMTGFAMTALDDGSVRVVMGFENGDQARTNADSRAALATGPAVGQGGDFADRFALTEASANGDVVVLDLAPAPGTFVLSDLSSGPVLYATC